PGRPVPHTERASPASRRHQGAGQGGGRRGGGDHRDQGSRLRHLRGRRRGQGGRGDAHRGPEPARSQGHGGADRRRGGGAGRGGGRGGHRARGPARFRGGD